MAGETIAARSSPAPWLDALWVLALAVALGVGLSLAWNSALGIDDEYEFLTLDLNAQAAAELFTDRTGGRAALELHHDRYYGVGFYAVSWPLRAVLTPIHAAWHGWDEDASRMAAQHVATFLFFVFGVFAFHRLLRLAGVPARFAAWSALFLLANPYLIGHASMNIKDAPFMTAWLLCLWRLAEICVRFIEHNQLRRRDFVWLGVCLALLLSIRIIGLLFAIPVLIAVAYVLATRREAWARHGAHAEHCVAWFAGTTVLLTWLAYPIFWFAPWRVAEAVQFMSRHYWHGCTTTWGTCMQGQDLPWHYLPDWLAVKVSLVGLGGALLASWLVARRGSTPAVRLLVMIWLVSVVAIVSILAMRGATLYNESRQVLFLVPMIYLAAFLAWARWKRTGRIVLGAGLAIAAFDHALAWPYQYVWFNEAARFAGVDRNFQTDYWRLATQDLARDIAAIDHPTSRCVYMQAAAQLQAYLRDSEACVISHRLSPPPASPHRPYLIYTGPELEGWALANDCRPVYRIRRSLFLAPSFGLITLHLCD